MAGMVAEGELGGESAPIFPITVLMSLGNGNPRHEEQYLTTATERNRSLFVNMKNQNLKKGRKVVHGGVVRCRVSSLVSARQVDTRAWGWLGSIWCWVCSSTWASRNS